MESEKPSVISESVNPSTRKAMVETLVPAGLTGAIREKAIDAMFLSLSVLHMSLEDVQRRIQEIAIAHHQPLDSPRVWLKFNREVRALALTHDPVKDLADQLTAKDRPKFLASVAAAKKTLGYSNEDVRALLKVVTLSNLGDPASAAKAFSNGVSSEIGDHANSVSGRNGVYSWDQKATGWGNDGIDGTGEAEKLNDDSFDQASTDNRDFDREEELDQAEIDVESIHRKAATHLNDRNYIGYRTFMENAELLDADHKGRGKAVKHLDSVEEQEPERISAKLKTNLWLASDATARGAIPDIMKKIRELQDLPEPSVMTQKALERMGTPLDKLVAERGEKKSKNRSNKAPESTLER